MCYKIKLFLIITYSTAPMFIIMPVLWDLVGKCLLQRSQLLDLLLIPVLSVIPRTLTSVQPHVEIRTVQSVGLLKKTHQRDT